MMEESIKESIWTIKKKDMVYSFGQMEGSTKEVGRMENNTVKVITHLPQEKLNMENGKKENIFSGFHEINLSKNNYFLLPLYLSS